jgi:hypothetical protein
LSERELDEIGGNRSLLVERIRRVYGVSVGDAEREINEWQETLVDWDPSSADGPAPMQPGSAAPAAPSNSNVSSNEKLVDAGAWPNQPTDESDPSSDVAPAMNPASGGKPS